MPCVGIFVWMDRSSTYSRPDLFGLSITTLTATLAFSALARDYSLVLTALLIYVACPNHQLCCSSSLRPNILTLCFHSMVQLRAASRRLEVRPWWLLVAGRITATMVACSSGKRESVFNGYDPSNPSHKGSEYFPLFLFICRYSHD
jgi:hypothetical protein